MRDKFKAQIMLITILVITVLSVIVVGIVGTALQNVRQTVSSQQNEQILNSGESTLLGLVERFSPSKATLSSVSTVPECSLISTLAYQCNIVSDQGVINRIQITDKASVEDFELAKDYGFDLDVYNDVTTVSYTGRIDFHWEGDGAMELSMVYELGGNMAVITDVIDPGDVFDNSLGDSLNSSAPNHPFNLALDPVDNDYFFTLPNIDNLPVGAKPQFIRFTLRRATPGTVLFSANGSSSLPLQVREFITSSYAPDSDVQLLTRVKSQIPFLPSLPGALYSVLGVRGPVTK